MAAYRERQQRQNSNSARIKNQAYIEGNTVRKTAYEPEQTPVVTPEVEARPRREIDRRPVTGFRRNMDFLTTAVLGISMAIVLVLALQFLKVSAAVTELDKEIVTMTKQYEKLRGENDSALFDIADDINLNEVYEIAVGKLGMVYPNHNQIVEFECVGDGYVRQYTSVPDAADEGNTDAVTQVLRRLLK